MSSKPENLRTQWVWIFKWQKERENQQNVLLMLHFFQVSSSTRWSSFLLSVRVTTSCCLSGNETSKHLSIVNSLKCFVLMAVCRCYGPRITVWEQSLCKCDTAAHINICKTQPAVNEEVVAVSGDIQRLKAKYILPVSLSVAQSNSRGRRVVRWKMIKRHVRLCQNVSKQSAHIDLDVTHVPSTRSANSGPHILEQKIRVNSTIINTASRTSLVV